MLNKNTKFSLLNIYQLLSFDVALGAIAVGYMATKLLNVTPNLYWWVILPLSVWTIYSLDHIIDGYKKKSEATIYRHLFHYIYRKQIIWFIILTSLVSITLSLLFLQKQIIIAGLVLSAITLLYLSFIYFYKEKRNILFQKELIIAFVYTSGIFLAPIIWHNALPPYPTLIVIINIFFLVWLEGVIISWFDYKNDIVDGHSSFTIIVGKKNTRIFIIIALVLLLITTITSLCFVTASNPELLSIYVCALINVILFMLIILPQIFRNNNYHRLIGESVFLLPFLLAFV